MHGRQRFWTMCALSLVLAACATVKSTEDLDQDDRAAEGEPDAGLEDDGDHSVEDDSSDDGEGSDVDDGVSDDNGDGEGQGDDGSNDDGSTDDGTTDDGSTDDGSTDDGTTDDGSTDDGTTDDGTTDDGTTDDDGTPDLTCITPTVGNGTDGLIDDLDDGNNVLSIRDGRSGYWVVYDDATATALAPSNDGDLTPTMVAANSYVAQVSGGPYTEWGASVGFTLRRGTQGEETCPYDATAYSGVRFKAKGTGSVRFKVRDTTTDADSENYDGHGAALALTSSFKTYTLCFDGLVQDYGTPTTLQKNKLLNMHWQADVDVSVSLTLDDVSLVSGTCTNSL